MKNKPKTPTLTGKEKAMIGFEAGDSSGSLAIFTAIRRASSLVSSLAADRRARFRNRCRQLLTVSVPNDEAVRCYFGRPGQRGNGERASTTVSFAKEAGLGLQPFSDDVVATAHD
jgi:hypothetical protein